jgi:hypothetical protein
MECANEHGIYLSIYLSIYQAYSNIDMPNMPFRITTLAVGWVGLGILGLNVIQIYIKT